jgi:predicted nucleotidyltransferase
MQLERQKEELSETNFSVAEKNFIETRFQEEKYPMSPEIRSDMEVLTEELHKKYPALTNMIVVGGMANGSYELRRLSEVDPVSDIDLCLAGNTMPEATLKEIAGEIKKVAKKRAISVDSLLNGENKDYFFDIGRVDEYIKNEEWDVLSLPFQCVFGDAKSAQKAVLEGVLRSSDKDRVWKEIVDQHAQSLSLHHGSWSDEKNTEILQNVTSKKIEKFGLPGSPEEYLKNIL